MTIQPKTTFYFSNLYVQMEEEEEPTPGPTPSANLQLKNLTITTNSNNIILPDTGYDGISQLNLITNVPQPTLTTLNTTLTTTGNTTIQAPLNTAYNLVNINVNTEPVYQTIVTTITTNTTTTITADPGYTLKELQLTTSIPEIQPVTYNYISVKRGNDSWEHYALSTFTPNTFTENTTLTSANSYIVISRYYDSNNVPGNLLYIDFYNYWQVQIKPNSGARRRQLYYLDLGPRSTNSYSTVSLRLSQEASTAGGTYEDIGYFSTTASMTAWQLQARAHPEQLSITQDSSSTVHGEVEPTKYLELNTNGNYSIKPSANYLAMDELNITTDVQKEHEVLEKTQTGTTTQTYYPETTNGIDTLIINANPGVPKDYVTKTVQQGTSTTFDFGDHPVSGIFLNVIQ